MSEWCYAVIKTKKEGQVNYELCELHYREGKILAHGEVFTNFDRLKELKDSYKAMAEAFEHPVIEFRGGNYYQGKKKLPIGSW
jgi:hypothetical protein